MAAIDRSTRPPSPCTNTCITDPDTKLCVGCLRTLEEIGMWCEMSAEEQWTVMDNVERRRIVQERGGSGPD